MRALRLSFEVHTCPEMLGGSVEVQGGLASCPGSTSAFFTLSWNGCVFQLSGGHKTIVYDYLSVEVGLLAVGKFERTCPFTDS